MNNLELWYGRAGQGKSSRILAEIEQLVRDHPFGSPIWWVVPPGASYATERRLVERLPAVMRVEILTLDRLADRLLSALIGQDPSLCENVSGQRLNQLGRRLLMFMVYDAHRAELSLLYRERVSLPFIDGLLMAIDELNDYEITRETVEKCGMRQSPKRDYDPTAMAFEKVEELLLLQDAFQGAIQQQGLWDHRQTLHVLQKALPHLALLRETVLFFDGFWQWTPLESRFVAGLSQFSRRSVVAVLLGETGNCSEEGHSVHVPSLFNPGGWRMVQDLKRVCREMSLRVMEDQTVFQSQAVPNRFHESPALRHLESQLFREVPERYLARVGEEVRVIAAQNERVEMVGVAEEIRRLALVDNIAYQDMMILTPYADESLFNLRDILEDMNIPYVMDEFPMFVEHPLARFLLFALDAGEYGITADVAISILKSEFPSMSRDDADWLLDYARRHELGDEDWSSREPWNFTKEPSGAIARDAAQTRFAFEDERAEGLRQRLIGNFTAFVLRLSTPEVNMKDLAFAIWELLENVGARSKVAEWMVNEDATLSPLEASLHEQAWEFVMDLLDDSMVLHGFLTLPTSAAISLLRIAISDHVLSTIPGKMDAVLVTDLSRAQGCEADVVFVLGTCDGMFPSRVHPSGLFLDEEREAFFAATNERLGATTEERQWDSRYDVYQALTRAKRRLYVTYPLSGRDGKAQRPANLVGDVKTMFAHSDLREELWTTQWGPFTAGTEVALWSPDRALRYMSGLLRQKAKDDLLADDRSLVNHALLRWIENDEQLSRRLSTMVKGLSHKPVAPQLLATTARWLYHGPTSVNVSQLETFAACPFRHFARYGLRLRSDEMDAGMKAFLGTLIHNGLQGFVERMMADPEAWRRADDETAERIMDAVFDAIHGVDALAPWRRKAVRDEAIEGVRHLLRQAARVLTLQVRRGRYQPQVVELRFEARLSDALLALGENQISAGELRVVGRIDRVDVAEDLGRSAFRIFDYKSSPKTLDPARVANGLQLQLPVYGAVIQSLSKSLLGRESELAAILYSPIVHRVQKVSAPDEGKAHRDAISGMKAAGLFVEDRQLVEWMDDALTGSEEDSPLFPKIYNRNGEVSRSAPVLSSSLWNTLLKNVLMQVVGMSNEIANGRIDIAPYRLKRRETACQQCEFSSLCHVEPRRNPYVFRDLQAPVSFAELLSSEEGGSANA